MRHRIGILTFHDTNNFGSWLQTYALYEKVRSLGIQAEVINYQCAELRRREKLTLRQTFKVLRAKDYYLYLDLLKRIRKQFWFWIYTRKYIKVSRKKYTEKSIEKANVDYDIFMIGSDLVWDTRITNHDYVYMLSFAEDKKGKIAYAASLGYDKIPREQVAQYREYLNRFWAITVREDSAQKLLREILDVNIDVVCDPTMLILSQQWKRFVKARNKYGDYVLVYFIDDDQKILRLARHYAHRHGYKIIVIADGNAEREQRVNPANVAEFLSLLFYAKKIFTASYHGILFSIYFEKQFVYSNRNPESRMRTVSQRLGMEDFEIHAAKFDIDRSIDYRIVTLRVNEYRRQSIILLEKILRECKK